MHCVSLFCGIDDNIESEWPYKTNETGVVLTLNSMWRFHKDCFGNQTVKTDGYNLFCSKCLKCPDLTLIATLMINRGPYFQRRYCFKVIFFLLFPNCSTMPPTHMHFHLFHSCYFTKHFLSKYFI
jgi:hypothetical protein